MKKSYVEIQAFIEEFEMRRLDCETDEQYAKLNKDIDDCNSNIFTNAIEMIACAENPVAILLDAPFVEQIAPVTNNGECVQAKQGKRFIQYSHIMRYIKKHNKDIEKNIKVGLKIENPFTNADITLFNIYGANLSKETLSSLEEKQIKRLAEFVPTLDCFKATSNTKLKEQLNHFYTRIEEVAGVNAGVKAIERNSKLIAMEFIKYKGLSHTLRINSVDKLIDLVICQYIVSRDKIMLDVKSNLDIHKVKEDAKTE